MKIFLQRAAFACTISMVMLFAVFIGETAAIEIENPLGRGATFDTIIRNVVRFANTILAPLSVIMVLIAAFLYMTAGGNPDRLTRANKTLLWALVGIAVVLLANGAEIIVRDVLGVSR